MNINNIYRDKTIDCITEEDVGKSCKAAGWVENIRDHGGVSFVDLRDMYGVLQVVMRDTSLLNGLSKEDCISIEGVIEHRDEETYNPKIPTGTIELEAHKVTVLGKVKAQLPFEIITSRETREDVRLKYRYLDLRNKKVKDNIPFTGYKLFKTEDDRDGLLRDSDTYSVCVIAGGSERLYRSFKKVQG